MWKILVLLCVILASFKAYAQLTQISVVNSVDLAKYVGRWYQVYTNTFTEQNIFPSAVCVTADYAIDSTTANQVTVLNAARQDPTQGDFQTIAGYAYIPDSTEPGKLKVHLGNVPVDGDYWIVLLGPETYGDEGLYEYALVSGPSGETLFLLVRDPETFAEQFEEEVLCQLAELGFTEEPYAPIPTLQEGCLYVPEMSQSTESHLTMAGMGKFVQAVNKFKGLVAEDVEDFDAHIAQGSAPTVILNEEFKKFNGNELFLHKQSKQSQVEKVVSTEGAQQTTVKELKVEKYLGRWYQAYSNKVTERNTGKNAYCVATDYGVDAQHPERITVFNMMRSGSAEGRFGSISGYAYAPNAAEPGQLKLQLSFIPFQGDYWIFDLGPETYGSEGLYEYAVVSGPKIDRLFVLVRDVDRFKEMFETDVLNLLQTLGFQGEQKEPISTPQAGCTYPTQDNMQFAMKGKGIEALDKPEKAEETEEFNLRASLSKIASSFLESFFPTVQTVGELIISQYTGRWFQTYASPSVYFTFERDASCVYADYAQQDDGTISVINTATKDGQPDGITGYAYVPDATAPGKLKVHFDAAPTGADGDYWVLALGPVNEEGLYEWSIVSDRLKALLFILARNVDDFKAKYEEEVLSKVQELGFTYFWNKPVETDQNDCNYSETGSGEAQEDDLSQDQDLHLGMPLHASCSLQWEFEGQNCAQVLESLVAAAQGMSGLDNCVGEKCGYSIDSASNGLLRIKHETPTKHYVDSISIELTTEDFGLCAVQASSSSDTWYAVLDNGTNYCNLHNLVEASGLGYKEFTSNSICTQFSSADCDTY